MPAALFVHTNFPAQFGFVAERLRKEGWAVAAIASATGRPVAGIPLLRWQMTRGTTENIFRPAVRAEADLLRGRAAVECAKALSGRGFRPDLVIGHPGWGETTFLKEVFPAARQVAYAEFYYRSQGADVGFDPEFGPLSLDERCVVAAKNATLAMAYAEADRIVAPTPFQAGLLPPSLHARLSIIHEGVDTGQARPDPAAAVRLPDGRVLDRSRPVVTFVNRRFEPLRGFHVFLRALPTLLERVPEAEVLLVGSDQRGGYGPAAPEGTTWKARMLAEVGPRLDMRRVHFTGPLPHAEMLAALAVSAAHVYYTYPFVLSWSLLEAMACEALVICSDTAPLRDVIEPGRNGLLLDFFDVDALSEALIEACLRPDAFRRLRVRARETILERFDRARHGLPAWLALANGLVPARDGARGGRPG
ncbi:glycosyltransferase [Propylenella binzhouense]|uniref:Glycosyltransferase n=1 Tax=Propylenella binzhouense TaxID=2555902 RepID=A0A964WSA1_9HYPH|nr:glycosyltransferase [Propylenella binzhouense]MYZ46747.1 glycosyltransferase [Propylenella binzhouense]